MQPRVYYENWIQDWQYGIVVISSPVVTWGTAAKNLWGPKSTFPIGLNTKTSGCKTVIRMHTICNTVHNKYFYFFFFMSMTLKYTRYYRHLFLCCSLSDKGLLACVIVFLAIPQVATGWISTISRSYTAAMVLSPVGKDMMIVELAAVSGRRKNLHSAPTSKLNSCSSDSKLRFLSQKKTCNTAGSEDVGLWYKTGGICKTDSENTRTPAWTHKLSAVRRTTQTQSQLRSWDSDEYTKQTAEQTGEWKHHQGAPWRRSAFFCLHRVCEDPLHSLKGSEVNRS